MYPGPKYSAHSSVGYQYSSKRSNTARFSFGTGIRDPQSPLRGAYETVPGAANVIKPMINSGAGPGEYGAGPESIGFQTLSPRRTLPSYTFGSTGTRTKRRDRFKTDRVVDYGRDSPGPCQYDGRIAAFGRSILSSKRMAQSAKFGSRAKFGGGSFKRPAKDRRAMTPGPGKYVLLSAVGRQTESQRPNTASAKFGSASKETQYDLDPFIPGPGQYSGSIGKEEMFGPKSPRFGFGTTRKFRSKAVVMKDQPKPSPRQQKMAEAIRKSMKR